jgi:putative hydrolase of the HAD superfamily
MNASPNEAIMVGDNLLSDIKPAQDLGITGVWFNKNLISNDIGIKPDFEVARLKELRDLL